MKARKEMMYEQLLAATIDAVKNHFIPEVGEIRKRIEALVHGEYLEQKDDADPNKFSYVA